MKNLLFKFGGAVAAFAFMVTSLNVNSACMFTIHQPKLPNSAFKLKKF